EQEATRDVAGQEIGRELDPFEAEVERPGDEAGDERFREAREILDEDVPVGEDAGKDLFEDVRLPDDHLRERAEDLLTPIRDAVDLHGRLSISAITRSSALNDGPRWRIRRLAAGTGKSAPPIMRSRGQRNVSKYRRLPLLNARSLRSRRKCSSNAGRRGARGGASSAEGGSPSIERRTLPTTRMQ